jgi:putative addiction module CopG family antidote
MANIERLTITLPADMAALVKGAVAGGDYASTSEVVREALRDREIKAEIHRRKLESLRREVGEGLKAWRKAASLIPTSTASWRREGGYRAKANPPPDGPRQGRPG